jgi:hypothetical protein
VAVEVRVSDQGFMLTFPDAGRELKGEIPDTRSGKGEQQNFP